MEPTMSQFLSREECLEARVNYFRKQRDSLLKTLKVAYAALCEEYTAYEPPLHHISEAVIACEKAFEEND